MSHFAVLVVGEKVEEQLQPFHEYECTGIDDQYVQDFDVTEEYQQQYEEDTTRAVQVDAVVDGKPGKSWVSAYGDPKVEEVPVSLVYPDFETYLTSYCGFNFDGKYDYQKDGRIFHRTNPNSKWDWWQVGGRYTGFFRVNSLYKDSDLVNVGNPGLLTKPAKSGYADSLLKKMIDVEGMRATARREANETWDKIDAAVKGLTPPEKEWQAFRKDFKDIEQAREAYQASPYIKALTFSFGHALFLGDPIEDFMVLRGGREAYVERKIRSALLTYAVVKDSTWYERGSMGWWGLASDEDDIDTWIEKYSVLIDSVSDDTLLTVVDCHI